MARSMSRGVGCRRSAADPNRYTSFTRGSEESSSVARRAVSDGSPPDDWRLTVAENTISRLAVNGYEETDSVARSGHGLAEALHSAAFDRGRFKLRLSCWLGQ
jgi:hypothetical protein